MLECKQYVLTPYQINFRAIKASHVLISAGGRVCLGGLKYACQIVQNGKWQRQIHSFPASTVRNLNWLSPELLEQNLQGLWFPFVKRIFVIIFTLFIM